MSFWTNNPAAPSIWQTLPFQTRAPCYLRPDMPPLLPDSLLLHDGRRATVQRLFGTQSAQVAAFLAAHYGDETWHMRSPENWIGSYLRDSEVVALGLFCGDELFATIFSVPLGATELSNGGMIQNLRIIEGLCVAPAARGRGVAGFMIGHADAFTSYKLGICAHLWSRELSAPPFWDTALRTDLYGYTHARGTAAAPELQTMPWSDFVALWTAAAPHFVATAAPCIVVAAPANRRGRNSVYYGFGALMVISNTERTGPGSEAIYEIVWSGRYNGRALMPAGADFDFQHLAAAIAGVLPAGALLFGTASPDCGGVAAGWSGWSMGYSGAHATYIYNYMPPAFGSCRILMVRDEL
jgi:hypothetical protein